MGFPRFNLLDLILLVAAVGVGLHTWNQYLGQFAEELVFATYLGLLWIATLGVCVRRPLRRPIFLGFASYSWTYLGLLLFGDLRYSVVSAWIGMAYGFMVGVVVRWVVPGGPFGPLPDAARGSVAAPIDPPETGHFDR